MHLHGHLKEDIREFGPIHAYWLFAYERILGNYPNNKQQQVYWISTKFSRDNLLLSVTLPKEFNADFTCTLFDQQISLTSKSTLPVKTLILVHAYYPLAQKSQFFLPLSWIK